MGYQTSYKLTIIKGDLSLIQELRKENSSAKFALTEEGKCSESCKWYDSSEDLLEFSKKHPDALLRLEGNGTDSADIWIEYFQNGKSQVSKAKIRFEAFDSNKLK